MSWTQNISLVASILNSAAAYGLNNKVMTNISRPHNPANTQYYVGALKKLMGKIEGDILVSRPGATDIPILTEKNIEKVLYQPAVMPYNKHMWDSPGIGYVGPIKGSIDYESPSVRTAIDDLGSIVKKPTAHVLQTGNMTDRTLIPYLHELGHALDSTRRPDMANADRMFSNKLKEYGSRLPMSGDIGYSIGLNTPRLNGTLPLFESMIPMGGTLRSEWNASKYGYDALKEVNAPWDVKKEYLKAIVPAYWSYMTNALPKII